MPTNNRQYITLVMPDGTSLSVEVTFTAVYDKNPFDKAPPYQGEDDGWTVSDLEVL